MLLTILAVPSSPVSQIVGWQDGALKVKIAAPPVDGKANRELVAFLAKKLDLSPSSISFKSGWTSRHKVLDIPVTIDKIQAIM